MNIDITVNLDDYIDTYEESVKALLDDIIKQEVMKLVKKDPRYKAYINKKANEVLEGLTL